MRLLILSACLPLCLLLPGARPLAESPAEKLFTKERRVLHTFVGEAPNDQFGWIGRNMGDADGDGVDDALLSAPSWSGSGPSAGKIYVYSGKTGALLFSHAGQPGEALGIGIERAGDVNADGHADALAGAPNGNGIGKAYVFSGKDGSVLLTLTSDQAGNNFGRKVGGAGDVNGDGHDDLLVGAEQHDSFGTDVGKAYLFSGKDGALLLEIDGEDAGDRFGVAINGHTSKDGSIFIIGAADAGAGNGGRVYVFRWIPADAGGGEQGDVELDFVIESDATGTSLGAMFVSAVGDVDGDGVVDVYASDWENRAKGPNTGRIYVHSGATGERLFTLTGEGPGDGFGIGTAEAGDVDGDGHDDLLIGAWQNSQGAPGAGKCYLYSGKDAALLDEYVCTVPGDTFGFDTTCMGDVDGDGAGDFLITSAWSNVRGPKSGRAFILAGPSRSGSSSGD